MIGQRRPTPVLSDHARARCAEMGISTKVVKRLIQHATLRMPGYPGSRGEPRTMVRSTTHHPECLAITDDTTGEVVTVMWWSPEECLSRETCQVRGLNARKE